MDASTAEARLAAAGFEIVDAVNLPRHALISRDGFVALVERGPAGYGKAGSAGLLTEKGFATLVWRGATAVFQGRGLERPAASQEIAGLRQFSSELDAALADG